MPKYSDILSRNDIDISSHIGHKNLELPIISSPMDTVTESEMACEMSFNGGMGIIHRYNTVEEQSRIIKEASKSAHILAAAVGVKGDYLERSQEIINLGCDIICIDVAHGDHLLVKNAIEAIRKLDSEIHIMAGNVATGDAFVRLAQWGANSIRVGIGGGSICSTRLQTGFGVPNMSAIFDCVTKWNIQEKIHRKPIYKPSLIIDGGISKAGDIVKALAAGADAVMCGSLLSGTKETPGELINMGQGSLSKNYRGMASKEAMKSGGKTASPEGIATTVSYKGPVKPILDDLKGNIKSGFSYAGARDLYELRKNAQFIKQSSAGQRESFTHILNR